MTKQPIAAWQDREFAVEAHDLTSTVFIAHVRYASTGGLTMANTHPFSQDGRLLAHNGAFTGLEELDRRLALGEAPQVGGDTDSERMFALITQHTRVNYGDVEAAIVSAITWIAASLPVYSLNLILATPDTLWALRYPATNELHILQRGATRTRAQWEAVSPRIHARSEQLAGQPSTVVASEPMDADPSWRPLEPGELVRIDADQSVHSTFPFPDELVHPLQLSDLNPAVATSQRPR